MTKNRSLEAQLRAILKEALEYKTVRSSWLESNLNRVLDDPMNWTQDDAVPSLQEPIGTVRRVTLLGYLGFLGGLKPDGDLRAIDAHKKFVPGYGMLVRREDSGKGLSLDYAREAAAEAGYLPSDSTVAELLDAINSELHGRLVYSTADMAEMAGQECPF